MLLDPWKQGGCGSMEVSHEGDAGADQSNPPNHAAQEKEIITFARRLAANEKKGRDQALARLKVWLAKKPDLSELDLLKIWKGLFYCMWMSDKVPVQQELAAAMSKLVCCFGEDVDRIKLFMVTYYKTLRREWTGLDKYRLDKYYSFMRLMLREVLTLVKSKSWQSAWLDKVYLLPLEEEVLTQPWPNGLRLHMCDLIVPELENVAGGDVTTEVYMSVLAPFYRVLSRCPDRAVFQRALDRVLLDFVHERAEKGKEEYFPHVDLEAVQARVFDVASATDTKEKWREDLYAAHKQLQKVTGLRMATYKRPREEEGEGEASKKENGDAKAAKASVDSSPSGGKKITKKEKKEQQKKMKKQQEEEEAAQAMDVDEEEEEEQMEKKEAPKRSQQEKKKEKKAAAAAAVSPAAANAVATNGKAAKASNAKAAAEVIASKAKATAPVEADDKNKKKRKKGQDVADEKPPTKGGAASMKMNGAGEKEAAAVEGSKTKKQKQQAHLKEAKEEASGVKAAVAVAATSNGESKKEKKVKKKEADAAAAAAGAAKQQAPESAASSTTAKGGLKKDKKGDGEKKEATPPAQFIASAKFAGAKAGYKFQKGKQGVGYYWDKVQTEAPRGGRDKKVTFGKVHVKVFKRDEGRPTPAAARVISFMPKKQQHQQKRGGKKPFNKGKAGRPRASSYF